MTYSEKVLPIKYPIITSYPWHACILSILSTEDKCFPWIFSNYIQLRSNAWINDTSQTASMTLEFIFFDHEYSDVIPWFRSLSQKLLRNTVDLTINKNNFSLCDFIIENINSDYYLILHLDDFYLPKTDFYQKRSIHHQNVIYGYNALEKTFYIGGFYKYHKFGFEKMAFSQFETAYNNSKDYPIKLLKLQKDFNWELSTTLVSDFLKDYLYSKESFIRMGIYSPAIFYNEKIRGVSGINVYRSFDTYIKNIIRLKQSDIDLRPFHMLWEHKKYMIELCKYLYQNNKLSNIDNIINDYSKIENMSLILRNNAIKYNISSQIKLFDTFESLIEKLSYEESKVLELILNNLK